MVEYRTRNRDSPCSIPPFATVSKFEHTVVCTTPESTQLYNERYMAIDSSGNVSEYIDFARNCSVGRMLLTDVELVSG